MEFTPENFEAFARLVLDAVQSGNWGLVAALLVVAIVWGLRKYGAAKWPFLGTDRGGALLVLATSLAGAVATALAAGSPLTFGILLSAFVVAVKAAGGFALVKKLLFGDAAKAAGQTAAVAVTSTGEAVKVLEGGK